MTFREKLAQEHPHCVGGIYIGGCHGCPHEYGYERVDSDELPCACEGHHENECRKCWDREIPGTLPMQYPIDTAAEAELAKPEPQWTKENPHVMTATIAGKNPEDDYNFIFIPHDGSYVEILGHRITGDFKTFEEFLEYLKDLEEAKRNYEKLLAERQNVMDAPEKKEYHAPYPNLNIDIGCTILDSGDRTEFATGAVRDMREGKGRCDLMPLEVVADLLPCMNEDFKSGHDPMLHDIASFQKTNDAGWLLAALGNFAIYAYDKSLSTMFLEVAKHFEEGAKKYGENNWQKGIPVHCYIDSAVRHYLKWLRGDKDEPHDRAFVWNLMCCIWEVDYSPRAKEES